VRNEYQVRIRRNHNFLELAPEAVRHHCVVEIWVQIDSEVALILSGITNAQTEACAPQPLEHALGLLRMGALLFKLEHVVIGGLSVWAYHS